MRPLSARLEQRDWLRDWPRQAVDDFDRSGMRLEGDTTHDRIQVICQAAFGAGEMEVTLQEVHGLLDRLDAWNGRHASALTWPTTTEGCQMYWPLPSFSLSICFTKPLWSAT